MLLFEACAFDSTLGLWLRIDVIYAMGCGARGRAILKRPGPCWRLSQEKKTERGRAAEERRIATGIAEDSNGNSGRKADDDDDGLRKMMIETTTERGRRRMNDDDDDIDFLKRYKARTLGESVCLL